MVKNIIQYLTINYLVLLLKMKKKIIYLEKVKNYLFPK